MNERLVLMPELRFGDLSALLEQRGWHTVRQATDPLVPGEPEHACFEREGARMVYTCNPVCGFRVLDTAHAGDPAWRGPLPVADAGVVRDWLGSGHERTLLRGVLAAAQLDEPSLAPHVAALRAHPRSVIAQAAERSLQQLLGEPARVGNDSSARGGALLALELLKQKLQPLLQALAHDRDGSIAASLKPGPADFLLAFTPEAALAARAAYAGLPAARVAADGELQLALAPAGMLADDNALSRRFPGGYRAIAHLLAPQRVWACWKYVRRGETAGVAYDGLVWLDERWVWFPKPYRVLSA